MIDTAVSASTLAGSSTIVPLVVDAPTGSTAVLLEKTAKGGTPPVIVRIVGVLAKTVGVVGNIDSGPGVVGGGAKGLLGAPLPPPHPPRIASTPSATVASATCSQ